MKAVKRIVVLGATAGLLIAGAGAAEANAGHGYGKSEKKHSKHEKKHYGKKHHGKKDGKKHHGKKDGKKVVVVNKNTGSQAFVLGNEGWLSSNIAQSSVNQQINDCGGGIVHALAFQNASINNNCVNVTKS